MSLLHACATVPLAATLLACGPGAPNNSSGISEGMEQEVGCVEREKIDILMVIEDSPAMADSPQSAAAAARALLAFFDEVGDRDYRIAFVGTSVSGLQCPARPGDDGELRTSSCHARLGEFADPAAGCTDLCAHPSLTFTPTPIDDAEATAPRPWIERISGASNLADGVAPADAAACLAPQGTAGCEFASPLAAMELALARTLDMRDPAFGFLRPDAQLVVAFLSDTPDCSVRPGMATIFDPAGDRVFWSDPADATPGLCWNAGVTCTPGPDAALRCEPDDHDLFGAPGTTEDAAVLFPVAHYESTLRGLVAARYTGGVTVVGLVGVPTGYAGGPLDYSTSCSADALARDGICPGCSAGGEQAAPPVRVRALAELFPLGDAPLTSMCGEPERMWGDLTVDLLEQLKPACVAGCVADADPDTPLLDPDCTVTETRPDGEPRDLPPCEVSADSQVVPAGVDACFAVLTDAAGVSSSPLDDLSTECTDAGSRAEIVILRTAPAPDATCVSVRCRESRDGCEA